MFPSVVNKEGNIIDFTMVNGNYVLYGDRSCSESEIVDDHVQTRTAERKVKRKVNRTANELQHSLNLAKLDNDTDSVKYEKKIKEPRLLRYIPTSEVEENYLTEKFETYDLRPTEELPRRHNFTKKPKNPSDGSAHYANSRSSSSCSSPNGNLPTISEQCEPYGTYRIRAVQAPMGHIGYENKLDKYFAKPKGVKTFAAKGSHPDSLYRVVNDGTIGVGKTVRMLRLLRWPIALFTICVALAVFVYFLVPGNLNMDSDTVNATNWEKRIVGAQSYDGSTTKNHVNKHSSKRTPIKHTETIKTKPAGTKTSEIDFYEAETDITTIPDTVTEKILKRKLPAPPIFPSHITPEIQYGNEKADLDKLRVPKLLDEIKNTIPSESTLKPHITQKPERPLAIYFRDGSPVTTTSTESSTIMENFANAESSNGLTGFVDRDIGGKVENTEKSNTFEDRAPAEVIYDIQSRIKQQPNEYEAPPIIQEFYGRPLINKDVKFTSGHSKVFGISIEEAEHMQSTTQHSLYNTRVSPTLPTWRDKDDSTTKKYPDSINNPDVPQCRSPSVPFCRGILPYDLAGPAANVGKVAITTLLPQIEYLLHTNCSERAVHFACALLEPECSPYPKLPCHNFCKAIVDMCDGSIPAELSSIFNCKQYPTTDCTTIRSPCLMREMTCGDGTCIPREWVCDGMRDCPAGEDEVPCLQLCNQNEYRCSSGMCITKRWLCDGYADCTSGEDESEELCSVRRPQARVDLRHGEPEEDAAGSAPAPSVRRPYRVTGNGGKKSRMQIGENDGSQELLMTSDSGTGFRRNFTRKPSASRLSPYTRSRSTTTEAEEITTETVRERKRASEYRTKAKAIAAQNIDESADDVNLGDLGIMEIEKTKEVEEVTREPTIINTNPRVTSNQSSASGRAKNEAIDKLERYIDGAAMLRKAARANREEPTEPPETNATATDRSDEMYFSAHASPCPSGELRCVDGRCIALAQLCDGTIDCSDHADEDNCFT